MVTAKFLQGYFFEILQSREDLFSTIFSSLELLGANKLVVYLANDTGKVCVPCQRTIMNRASSCKNKIFCVFNIA